MTTDLPNLAAALAAFQGEMPTVGKGKTAKVKTKTGSDYAYTYATLADISEVAMPLLAKNGLSFTCLPRLGDRFELVGRLLHTSGETLEGVLPIAGNTPQEMGSSLTYMRRYLLGCMTGLVTDDDDDGQLASKPAARKTAAKKTTTAPVPPAEAWEVSDTGEVIQAVTRGQMFALFAQKGVPESAQLAGINAITGKAYTSRADLTEHDAKEVIRVLRTRPDVDPTSVREAAPAPAVEPSSASPAGPEEPAGEAEGEDANPAGSKAPRPRPMNRLQERGITAALRDIGVDDDPEEHHLIASTILGRAVPALKSLDIVEAETLLEALAPVKNKEQLAALLDGYDARARAVADRWNGGDRS